MTRIQVFLLVLVALLFLNGSSSCNVGTVVNYISDLNVPYHKQDCPNYCGIACVQMWAHFDGWLVSQADIAKELDLEPTDSMTNPYELEMAVGMYTLSFGYLARKHVTELGGQGDLISASIEGVRQNVPSIMPLYAGLHTALVKGYEWNEKPDGRPYAITAYVHDPWNGEDLEKPANIFMGEFDPAPFYYWVILGWEDFLDDGSFGHDTFVMMGGTYYGGPAVYNPKNLDITPMEN
jgi:hypothetical protein